MDLHGYYVFVDLQVDSISDSAEYIGKECPIQADRQNQGEKIHRGVELHSYDVFVDILSQTKRNTLAKNVHTARQIKPGRKNSQRDGPYSYYVFIDIKVDSIPDSVECIGIECPIQ
jgi:hypothetical protein